MLVRPLTPEDVGTWHALMVEGTADFPSAFLLSTGDVAAMTQARRTGALAGGDFYGVCTDTNEIMGFAAMRISAQERTRHRAAIGPFFIRQRHHGSGAADHLMQALAVAARAARVIWLDLWVAQTNPRAQAFYARHGFVQIGRRVDAVRIEGQPEDDVLMTCDLEAAGQDS